MASNHLLGRTVGDKYRVLRLLGEGGMGAVYEAQNVLTLKRVAIKIMHAALAADGQSAARMMREAQTASRIRHPNVVDVYDAGQEGHTVFIVMEFLEGESLAAAVRRGMPLHEAISLLIDAMRGVAAGHRVGVIHRDIKPENIFLAREGDQPRPVAKVLDFGVSKLTDDEAPRLTRTDVTIGTPIYMSYEQLSGRRDQVDARSDVYAFGVILYELLTGRVPHLALTLAQLGIMLATVEPPTPSSLRPELPVALDGIVRRATAKQRRLRTKSLDVLIAELAPFARADGFDVTLRVAEPLMPGDLLTTRSSGVERLTTTMSGGDVHVTGGPVGTAPSLPAPRRGLGRAVLGAAGLIGLSVLSLSVTLYPTAQRARTSSATTAPRTLQTAEQTERSHAPLTPRIGVAPTSPAHSEAAANHPAKLVVPDAQAAGAPPFDAGQGAVDASTRVRRPRHRAGNPRPSEF